MSALLDTGVWLRAVTAPETIPASILKRLRSPQQSFYLAAISLWEIAKKVQIGKLVLPKKLDEWFDESLTSNLVVLPMTSAIAWEITRLGALETRDPADELIVATARVHDLCLLTTDRKLKHYESAKIDYFKPIIPE